MAAQDMDQALSHLFFRQREENFHHHTYEEDMEQYSLLARGDPKALSMGKRMFEGSTTGKLSDNPVKNYKYLFVASITLACRFCIEGGLDPETAFGLSDLYIRRADACTSVQEIFDLHAEMFSDYLSRMQNKGSAGSHSIQVENCLLYIDQHLHSPLPVTKLAEEVNLTPTYLSALFSKEMGIPLSRYIRKRRVEAAKTLLSYTDNTVTDIAQYLCFSSCSHFSKVFYEETGLHPEEYRKSHYKKHWTAAAPVRTAAQPKEGQGA